MNAWSFLYIKSLNPPSNSGGWGCYCPHFKDEETPVFIKHSLKALSASFSNPMILTALKRR